ncbi:MAG: prohibitin family protein [Methylomonas sp.]|nr:prohibitin family protein [Methylomonas sp.]
MVYFFKSIFITINAGEAGVLYKRFSGGTVTDIVYNEGFHVIFPWDIMTIYNTRVQEKTYSLFVLTAEGLQIELIVSIRYYPERPAVAVLHQKVGPDYLDKIVVPEIDDTLRQTAGTMTLDDIYMSKGASLYRILAKAIFKIEKNYVTIQDVIVRQIILPKQVAVAIESKVEQKQLSEAYLYRLEREKKEAERRIIEAEGIYQYNTKINKSLNGDVLKWKGIEATQALAGSNNSKVIVIGSGGNQLPIILGGGGQ